MRKTTLLVTLSLLVSFATFGLCLQGPQKKPVAKVNYAKQIAPIFKAACLSCHSGPKPAEGLDLSTKAGILKGGKHGPGVVAGKPDKSKIYQALIGKGAPQMPPKSRGIAKEKVAQVLQWIKEGAKF